MPKYVAVVLLCLWLATTFTVGIFVDTRERDKKWITRS